MTQGRVIVRVIVETKDPSGKTTKADEWDIITGGALASRAAIERYVSPSQQKAACEAVARIINGPLPDALRSYDLTVPNPFEAEDEQA